VSVFCFLQDGKIETEEQSYQVSQTAIKDKSMLSTQAQKLCENIDAYWMTPTCGADSKERKCSQCHYFCTISLQFYSAFLHLLRTIEFYCVSAIVYQ